MKGSMQKGPLSCEKILIDLDPVTNVINVDQRPSKADAVWAGSPDQCF